MEDLERTLVLLRESPEGAATEHPGVDQLPALFDTARAAGSPVEALVDLSEGKLPGVPSRESYRIVQEGVTNALKYAPGEPISIRIAFRGGQLELRCAQRDAGRRGRRGAESRRRGAQGRQGAARHPRAGHAARRGGHGGGVAGLRRGVGAACAAAPTLGLLTND
ncbi:hypothetical protein ACWC9T_15705 [Kitasatospora sp. NPDC001159]